MNIFYGHNKCKQDKKISCLKNYTQWLLYVSEGVKDVLKEKNLISDQQGYEKMPSIIRQALNNNNNTNPPTPQPNQKTEKPLTVIPQFNSSQTELVYDEINTVYYPVRIIKDSNLTSLNIVKGVTIYGVTGTKECNNGGGTNPIELSTLTVPLNQMPTKTFNAPSNSAYNKVILQADVFQNKSLTLGSTLNGVYINCTIPQGSSPINLQTFNLYNNSFDSSDTIVAPQGTAYNRIVNHIPKYKNQQVSLGSTLNGLYLNCTVPQGGGGGNTGLQPDSLSLSLNDLAYNNIWQPPYGKGYTSVNLNNVNKYLNTTVLPGQVLNGICYNVTVPNNPISPSINVIPYNKVVTSTSLLPNNEQAPSGSAYSPITVTIPSTHDIYNKSQILTIGSLLNTNAVEPHVLEGFTFYLKNSANQLKFKTGTIPNRGTVEQSAPFEASNCYFQHIRITGGGSSGGGNPMSNSRFNLLATHGNIGNEIKAISKEEFMADPSLLYAGFTISVLGGTYFFRVRGFSIGTNKSTFSSYTGLIIYPQNNSSFISDNNPTATFSISKSGLAQSLWWMANFGRLSPPEGEYKVFNSAPYKAIVGGYNLFSAYEWKALDTYFRLGNSENIWDYLEDIQDSRVGLTYNNGKIWTTTPVMYGGQLKVWSVDLRGRTGVDLQIENMNTQLLGIDATKFVGISLYDGL